METAVATVPGIADPVVVVAIHPVVGPVGLDIIGSAVTAAEDVHRHVGIDTPAAIDVCGTTQPGARGTLTKTDGHRIPSAAFQGLVGIDGLIALEIGIGIDVDDPPHRALLGGQFADRRTGLGRGLGRGSLSPRNALAVAAHTTTDPGRLKYCLGGIPRRASTEDHRIIAGDGELRPDIRIPGQKIHGIAFLTPNWIAVGCPDRTQRHLAGTGTDRIAMPPLEVAGFRNRLAIGGQLVLDVASTDGAQVLGVSRIAEILAVIEGGSRIGPALNRQEQEKPHRPPPHQDSPPSRRIRYDRATGAHSGLLRSM